MNHVQKNTTTIGSVELKAKKMLKISRRAARRAAARFSLSGLLGRINSLILFISICFIFILSENHSETVLEFYLRFLFACRRAR